MIKYMLLGIWIIYTLIFVVSNPLIRLRNLKRLYEMLWRRLVIRFLKIRLAIIRFRIRKQYGDRYEEILDELEEEN